MVNLNRFQLLGNVASLKVFDKATKVTIAARRLPGSSAGDDKPGPRPTDFITVAVLNAAQAAWVAAHVAKGDRVFVEGRIQSSQYEKDGRTVYATDLVVSIFELNNTKVQPHVE